MPSRLSVLPRLKAAGAVLNVVAAPRGTSAVSRPFDAVSDTVRYVCPASTSTSTRPKVAATPFSVTQRLALSAAAGRRPFAVSRASPLAVPLLTPALLVVS